MKKYFLAIAMFLSTGMHAQETLPGFHLTGSFHEQATTFLLGSDVKVHLNAPAPMDRTKPILLVFFALPNGSTTAQTIGKAVKDSADWKYDIQHIGAQTRFLRETIGDRELVVAYLECTQKSWPAWRRAHPGNAREIAGILDSVRGVFKEAHVDGAITGHSGGGSLAFGFLNGVDTIPSWIERIAFLDSDYAYDDSLHHGDKLAVWLGSSDRRFLCVLAYNDSIALLNGKPFVSATGGTWYRSKLMMKNFSEYFQFSEPVMGDPACYSALEGRIQFWMKENPRREVLHTVQVDVNGFIHALLTGTENEGKGYTYFGPRAYAKWIGTEDER
jgi:hypothetical protein